MHCKRKLTFWLKNNRESIQFYKYFITCTTHSLPKYYFFMKKLFTSAPFIATLLLLAMHVTSFAQYCTPTYFQGCTLGSSIEDFRINGESGTSISDLGTGCATVSGGFPPFTSYRDNHSTMSVTLAPATTYTVVASKGGLIPTNPEFQIFIDFNDNGSFLDAGESVGGGTFGLIGTTNFPISIPAGAAPGIHRLRAVASGDETYPGLTPCPSYSLTGGGSSTIGEVHDYSVNIVTPCAPVTGLAASAITATSATISWTAVTGAIGYEWAVTTSMTPPATGTLTTATSVPATGLTAATAYYAHVRTKCSATTFATWVSIPFTTTSTTTPTCDTVTTVTMSSITSSGATLTWTAVAGATGYEWAVNTTATPPASGTATTLTTATASGLTASTAYYAWVRTQCGATFSAWVRSSFTTGATSTCPPITGLAVSAITGTSATVTWTPITTGSLGYQYVIDNMVTDPTGSGTNTTATATSPTGLMAGTTYYAHVRDSCGAGSFSAWNTIPFTTLSSTCNAVTGLAASAITTSSATLTWTMATGAVAAQYVVDLIPTDPTTSGTVSTTSTAAISGLTASTTYYAHVRDSCGATALSAWVTIPFTTLGTSSIYTLQQEATPLSISAYPNPVNNQLTIAVVAGSISANAQILLTDITGKTIKNIAPTGSTTVVDVAELPTGLYLVRYTDGTNNKTVKINKQ
jgi:hypothetical protein